MADKIKFYFSSVSSNLEMKKQQQKIEMILDGKKIDYEKIDISTSEKLKNEMREIMGDPKGLPPQLAKGHQYLGGFDEFDAAVENEQLVEFLKLK